MDKKSYQKFSHFRKKEEFQEEDVWSVLNQDGDTKPKSGSTQKPIWISSKSSNGFPSAARMIQDSSAGGSGQARSAPVNVPADWSRINGNIGKKESDEGEEDEDSMIPPHEWLARKRDKKKLLSSSVCEGAGRTLKGRDLRKVRYAVLTRTGFLE